MNIEPLTWSQLTDRLRTLLDDDLAGVTQTRIPRNAHVYNCGDHDSDLYFIEEGQIKTITFSPSGKTCLLSIYTRGDIFGELCLYGGRRLETAAVMRTATLRRIPAPVFCTALADVDVLETFLGYLAFRLSEQQEVITNLVTMDSERRLAAVLLLLARRLGRRLARWTRIEQRITHEELSCMVGTTRSRVGYFLKRFGIAGLVQFGPRRFLMVDEVNLNRYLSTGSERDGAAAQLIQVP